MDITVSPCDNFYEYACGNFSKNALIPDDQPYINSFVQVRNQVQKSLKRSIEKSIDDSGPRTFKILKSYYKSCMNEGSELFLLPFDFK